MFENGDITPTRATLPGHLEKPTVKDIVPGQAWYVDHSAIWVDQDKHIWINDKCPLIYDEDDFVSNFIRIIVLYEGIILDVTEFLDSNGNLRQFEVYTLEEHIDDEEFDIGEFQAINDVVYTQSKLKELEAKFINDFGITLDGATPAQKKLTGSSKSSKSTKKKMKKQVKKNKS